MNEQEFRSRQKQFDDRSMDARVRRWKELETVTFEKDFPDMLWEYSCELTELFIGGHFVAVILMCAALAEIMLSDQLGEKLQLPAIKIDSYSLERKTREAYENGLLTEEEKLELDTIRKLRNDLIHVKVDRLKRLAVPDEELDQGSYGTFFTGEYLFPRREGGIEQDVRSTVQAISSLETKFYGQ